MTTTTQPLVRLCSYCRRLIGDDNMAYGSRLLAFVETTKAGDNVTHGLCKSCHYLERKKLARHRAERNG